MISNRAGFFQDVHRACQLLLDGVVLQQLSIEVWQDTELSGLDPSTWLVKDMQDSAAAETADPLVHSCDCLSEAQDAAFAATRFAHTCDADVASRWEVLSRQEFTLRLQELTRAPVSDEPFVEQVVVKSPHLRVAEFQMQTKSSLIPRIRDRLLQSIRDFGLAPETDQNHFCMALDEALANAFYHGNLELCSLLKEDDSSRFYALAAEREQAAPWGSRRIKVTEIATCFGFWVTIQDEGRGFDVAAAFERCNNPEFLLSSGRGLMMMQAFADELFFNSAGNQVNLVLYSRNPLGKFVAGPGQNHGIESCIALS